MATSFPSGLDTFLEIFGDDRLRNLINSKRHSVNHNNLADAVRALEVKVGVNGSDQTASFDYRINALEDGGGALPEVVTVSVSATFPVTRNGSDQINSFTLSEEYPVAQTAVSVSSGVVTVQPGLWAVEGLMFMQAQTPPPGSSLQLYPASINVVASSFPIADGTGTAQTYVTGTFYVLEPAEVFFTYPGNLADLSFATVNLTKLR